MPDNDHLEDRLAEAQRQAAEAAARERQLEATIRAEEAAEVLGRVNTAKDLERLDIRELDALRDANAAAYAEMRERLQHRYDPAGRLREQMETQLANPEPVLGTLNPAGAMEDADLYTALDLAGETRIVPAATIARISDEQLARLKRDAGPRGDAFRRSLEALATSGRRELVAWAE